MPLNAFYVIARVFYDIISYTNAYNYTAFRIFPRPLMLKFTEKPDIG